MNVKKIAAVLSAAVILGVSLNLTPAAIDNVPTDEQEITSDTSVLSDSSADDITSIENAEIDYEKTNFLLQEEYDTLTESQKSNFVRITVNDLVTCLVFVENPDTDRGVTFTDGTYYLRKNQEILYSISPETYQYFAVCINGERINYFDEYGSSYSFLGWVPDDVSELVIDVFYAPWVVYPDEYNSMSEAQKASYTKTTINGMVFFLAGTDNADEAGKYFAGTYYVRNDLFIYIATNTEYYVGHDILVNGSTLDVYLDNEEREVLYGGYYYLDEASELNISIQERELTDREKDNYVKVDLAAGTYALRNYNYKDHPGYELPGDALWDVYSGNYARKGEWYYIAANTANYTGNEIYVNGTKLDVEINYDGSNYGAYYQVKDTDTELTVTLVKKPSDDNDNSGNTGSTTPSTSVGGYTPAPGIAPGGAAIAGNDETAIAAITKASEGDKVTVSLTSGTTQIDKAVLESFAGKDITVKFSLSGGAYWEINGTNIDNAKKVDLGVRLDRNNISASKITELAGDKKTVQISLKHNGDFGFTGILNIPVSSKYNGQYANLYYYNKNREFDFVGSSKIDGGKAGFRFAHASDYVIVVDTYAYGDDVSSAAGVYEKTSYAAPYAGIAALTAVIGTFVAVIRRRSVK